MQSPYDDELKNVFSTNLESKQSQIKVLMLLRTRQKREIEKVRISKLIFFSPEKGKKNTNIFSYLFCKKWDEDLFTLFLIEFGSNNISIVYFPQIRS